MNIGEHYKQHKILGTPSTKDNSPLLLPKFTEEQRDELTEAGMVEEGMIIFNTTTNVFQGYDGISWTNL